MGIKKKFIFFHQADNMDCGPACIKMIAKYYGCNISIQRLRELSETTRLGSSLQGLSRSAETIGFRTLAVKVDYKNLVENAPFPCICFWNENHYVVVYKISKGKIFVADPAHGILKFSKQQFLDNWIGNGSQDNIVEGIALLLEPTNLLLKDEDEDEGVKKLGGIKFLFDYIKGNKRLMIQLAIGLLISSLLQLIFPFLTQSVVDIGIQNKDYHFLYLILFGQLFVFFGRTSVEIIRGWILLHLSTRINISLVSNFLIKLMKLPISFFDVKMTGDLMQRISDHKRVEHLLTNQSLGILFSTFNFIIFGIVLCLYSIQIFLFFLFGTALYFVWISFFMKKRKSFDNKKFTELSNERMKIMELISGMQEIKLHNAERQKRWGWETVQIRIFKLQLKSLKLEQIQSQGAAVINELKNILISFFSAKLVIEGELTLGMMLSVSYIIGQLNSPVSQFLSFIFSWQDAKISLERLAEIHNKEDEELPGVNRLNDLPDDCSLEFVNVTFRYVGSDAEVLKNVNLLIPKNKITAIVGASGSGKTTLMKLLLRFYEPINGKIRVGSSDLNSFTQFVWRENCGSVMQDGFLFSDTIANNIAVGVDRIDKEKLRKAVHIANIQEFIESLPLSYNTKIGAEGMGISGGQKQRILIARAVYKNPQFLFFDEATSALDAQNENVIMQNLSEFFTGRTAVVIAHRLSTVKNADQIIVMDNGAIIEKGTHRELLDLRGSYYNLVKNQLELEKIEALTQRNPGLSNSNS